MRMAKPVAQRVESAAPEHPLRLLRRARGI